MEKTTNIFITDSDYSCDDKSFRYLLGFQPSSGGMVLTKKELYIILDSRYFLKTKNIGENNIRNIIGNEKLDIKYINSKNIIDDIIEIVLSLKTNSKIIIEGKVASEYMEKISVKTKRSIDILKGGYFSKKRIEKNNLEKQNIEKAIEIIDKVFLDIEKLNKKGGLQGKTELQVGAIIISKIMEYGGTGESFPAIVAFGENSAVPHHTTGNTVIGNGVLLIDMGAVFNGYCSDFTRTIWVGEENFQYKKFCEIYDIVKEAHLNAFKNGEVLMTGKQIDLLTRKYIKTKGYAKNFTHTTGHGVGLDIHEKPSISIKSKEKIKDNMVFTIEPGIYLPGEFGIRLEDIVVAEDGKLKKYTKVKI